MQPISKLLLESCVDHFREVRSVEPDFKRIGAPVWFRHAEPHHERHSLYEEKATARSGCRRKLVHGKNITNRENSAAVEWFENGQFLRLQPMTPLISTPSDSRCQHRSSLVIHDVRLKWLHRPRGKWEVRNRSCEGYQQGAHHSSAGSNSNDDGESFALN